MRHWFSPPGQSYKEHVVGNDIHQAGPKIGCKIQVHHYLIYCEAWSDTIKQTGHLLFEGLDSRRAKLKQLK